MKITEKQFAVICYLVLMNHHGQGINEAHPSYVEEKLPMINEGYDAYGFLDRENQLAVKSFLLRWGYDLPERIVKYEDEFNNLEI